MSELPLVQVIYDCVTNISTSHYAAFDTLQARLKMLFDIRSTIVTDYQNGYIDPIAEPYKAHIFIGKNAVYSSIPDLVELAYAKIKAGEPYYKDSTISLIVFSPEAFAQIMNVTRIKEGRHAVFMPTVIENYFIQPIHRLLLIYQGIVKKQVESDAKLKEEEPKKDSDLHDLE